MFKFYLRNLQRFVWCINFFNPNLIAQLTIFENILSRSDEMKCQKIQWIRANDQEILADVKIC